MATSGSTNFAATRNQVIRQAALHVGAISAGVTMGNQMQEDIAHILNALVKSWQEMGVHIWTTAEATLFPAVEQVRYGMGTGATDHVTGTYYETAITSDEAAAETTLSVDETTNITAADNIGIVLDDGTLQWTTVSSKTSSTVTIATGLTGTASADNPVFTYTSKIGRPLRVLDVRRYNIASAEDTPIELVSRSDYQALPNKTGTGGVNQVWYDQANTIGYLSLWQPPALIQDLVKFTYARAIEDFDAAADNPDIPQGWVLALEWNLAMNLTAQYPVKPMIFQRIAGFAEKYLDEVSSFDREAGPVFFQPRMR